MLARIPRRRLLACALLAAGGPVAAGTASDVVDRPSLLGPRGPSRLQLALARAGDRLVSVGERGTVLLSDDGGRAWRQARSPVSVTLTAVAFVDARLGWAAGHSGVVLHTADGGETWARQLEGRAAAAAMLEGARLHGEQAQAQAQQLVADGPDKPLFDVHFWNAEQGLVVGAYGLILRTADGGRTWQSAADLVDNPGARHLYRIAVRGERCYIAGEQGLVFGGRFGGPLQRLPLPYDGTCFGVLALPGEALLVYGLRGHAFVSEDAAGLRWRALPMGALHTVTGARVLRDGGFVLVDEGGRVLIGKAIAGELTPLALPMPSPMPFPLADVVQAADGALVVAGTRGVLRLDARLTSS